MNMRTNAGLPLLLIALAGCSDRPAPPAAPAVAPSTPRATATAAPSPTALHEAALRGDVAAVQSALAAGLDVNGVDEDGRTALMLAAFDGHTEVVDLLLRRGARVDTQDGAGRTALMYAASGPNTPTVQRLLAAAPTVDLRDREEHFTALMFAAAEGQAENVRALLQARADPALTDVDGDNARKFALERGFPAVAALLESSAPPTSGAAGP